MTESTELTKILATAMESDNTGIPTAIISDLIFRVLFTEGDVSVARFVEAIRVHSQILDEMLAWMQQEHLV